MTTCCIGFYGPSKTGKTTLIERLIAEITREGYVVATIKQTDKNTGMDTVGKDTWKHSHAGAHVVALVSPIETDIILKRSLQISQIINLISRIGSFDCIFVEGASDPDIPKIRVGVCEQRINTVAEYHDNYEEIVKLIKKKIDQKKKKK
ncbi:MAG: molybdopterin-guanine dinucleotide biosynthesis protein B [Methanobacteriota archaeon]